VIAGSGAQGTPMCDHCHSLGVAAHPSAGFGASPKEKRIGQFASVQRSLLFCYIGLEQGADQH
jgi:hypothetical protein